MVELGERQANQRSAWMATKIGRRIVAQSFKQVQEKLEQNNVPKAPTEMSRAFIDTTWVRFQGGRGGDGCISMLSLFCNEFAGPDGGNGGNGGHVVLRANSAIKSLNAVNRQHRGEPGVRGMSKNLYGANGAHTFVEVPVGTLVLPAIAKELRDHQPAEDLDKSPIIADLDVEGSMFIAARGGAGGRGNAAFLSNTNRHPRVAEAGALGETNTYELRLKMYAHVALVGLPNVGKSSLLKTLTGARVQVGNYAFTTRHPQVGTIELDNFKQLAISDLPGLVEDSHKNRGLGVQFLASLRRCICLLYVIDLSAPDVVGQFERLISELELYRAGTSWQPHLVFGNKLDSDQATERAAVLAEHLAKVRPNTRLIVGSSRRGDGLESLRTELKRWHEDYEMRNADELDQPLKW